MPRLTISLLGTPKIAVDSVPLKIPTYRLFPLIAYLAITESSQSRETLANILWSDSSPAQALASLRTTLWRLKSAGLEDWITLENNRVSLNYHRSIEVDVLEFKAKLNKCIAHGHPPSQICIYCLPLLVDAVDLYHGEFMFGFNLSKTPVFDEWRFQEAEALQITYIEALEKLVKGERIFGDFNRAIHYARLLLRQDRYNEAAQYNLLQLYSITGQRAAAINQYKRYKNLLSHDLVIQPSEEITELYKQILTGHFIPSTPEKVNSPIFLIADIENPVMYWTKAGARKNEILSSYHNIFTETSKRFGGSILQKSEGNITLLFEKGQPLHCAVTIHLKSKNTDWGSIGPPNIRMVLYSTATEDNSSNSFASITRDATSLLSASWGGQVLFSEQTSRVLDLLSGSSIKDLGFHTFRDIKSTLHVFQLMHPHLPQVEQKPLQSGSTPLVNFPKLTPSFIGREKELNELSDMIEFPDNRLISLVGPGGIGKTRLAIQFATRIANSFSDGAYFISLAPIQEANLIPIVLADTLRFTFFGPKDYAEQVGNYLHHMHALLVLDNFEHLRREGVKFLAYLLERTHNLKILITTRERLNMISESIMEVNGFPVPSTESVEKAESYSSVRLFLHNAQRTLPKFSLEGNLASIIHICQLVEGLPLGIILASSWVRMYSCPQIAEEIKKNIDFLTTIAPDLPPRHRSLRAVFDHSWELLPEDERIILRKLSIFPSSFTPHAAQEICTATPQDLASLLDKSLLYYQNDHFEILQTFHQYARYKLEGIYEEYLHIQSKFIDYYADYCEQRTNVLNSSRQPQALSEIFSEMDNIHTAWDWMVDTGRWDAFEKFKQPLLIYLVIAGNVTLGRELYHRALNNLNQSADPSLRLIRATIQQNEAYMTLRIGFITEALPGLATSLETFRNSNSPLDIVVSLLFISEAHRRLGNLQEAKKNITEALQIAEDNNFSKSNFMWAVAAHCQAFLGMVCIDAGDLDSAKSNLQASLAIQRRIGTNYGTILPLQGLGKLANLQGEFIQSRDFFLQALETATDIYDQQGMSVIHNNLSAVYENLADPVKSHHHLLTALTLSKDTGDRSLTAIILNNLAYHQLRYLTRPSDAIRTYQESIEVFFTLGDLRGLAYSYYDISKAYLQAGLVDEARSYCSQSLQTAMTLDNIPLILHSLHGFANLFAHLGQVERALRLCSLIEHHPLHESDTQKRVIVSKFELEARLSAEIIASAHRWAESANLQDVIDQLMAEK